jgi:hypothetical protein
MSEQRMSEAARVSTDGGGVRFGGSSHPSSLAVRLLAVQIIPRILPPQANHASPLRPFSRHRIGGLALVLSVGFRLRLNPTYRLLFALPREGLINHLNDYAFRSQIEQTMSILF